VDHGPTPTWGKFETLSEKQLKQKFKFLQSSRGIATQTQGPEFKTPVSTITTKSLQMQKQRNNCAEAAEQGFLFLFGIT
jgi:hypothetical protein